MRIPASQIAVYTNSISHGSTCHAHIQHQSRHYFIKFKRDPITEQWDRMALCEVVASRLAFALGLYTVAYELCLVDLMNGQPPVVGCMSEYYHSDNEVIFTAQSLCDSQIGRYHVTANSLQQMGFSNEIDTIITFDYIIGNKDRHATNIEFIALDLDEMYMAPLFDYGTSLLKSFAPYPATWDIDQITNNFLTYSHTQLTFSNILHTVQLNSLGKINWEHEIYLGLEEYITAEEKQMITSFVTHNYNKLLERGLINERRV